MNEKFWAGAEAEAPAPAVGGGKACLDLPSYLDHGMVGPWPSELVIGNIPS